jgi:hypothetical protein
MTTEAESQSSTTQTIIWIVAIVVALGVVGYFMI